MANRMKQASDLFSLVPRRQLVDIFSEWLEIGDIGKFDSAACNATFRQLFLDLVQADCYVFSGDTDDATGAEFFKWSIMRRIKLARISIDSEAVASDFNFRRQLLVNTGRVLKSIEFCSDVKPTHERFSGDDDAILRRSATTQQVVLDIAELCPNLSNLMMFQNVLDGAFCLLLTRCNRLQSVDLYKCAGVSNNILRCLCDLPDLHVLLLSGCRFLSDALEFCHQPCLSLQTLRADEHRIPLKSITAFICLFPNLTELCVTSLDPPCLCQIIQACPLIRKADLTVTRGVPEEAVQFLANTWDSITALSLVIEGSIDAIMSEASMLIIVAQCKCLQSLVLRRNQHRDFKDTSTVLQGTEKSALQFLLCEGLAAPTLRTILSLCPNLRKLGILQPSTGHTAQNAPNPLEPLNSTVVRSLQLQYCVLTPTSLNTVVDMLEIVLDGCTGLNAASLASLAQRCPRLELLTIRHCPSITAAALANVVTYCPELRTLILISAPGADGEYRYQYRTPKDELLEALLRRCCPCLSRISIF